MNNIIKLQGDCTDCQHTVSVTVPAHSGTVNNPGQYVRCQCGHINWLRKARGTDL